jgi:hypothetical protein
VHKVRFQVQQATTKQRSTMWFMGGYRFMVFYLTTLTPKGPKAIFRPFLKFGQAIVKTIFIKHSWIKLWIGGLVLASRCTNFYKIPIFGLVLMSQNTFFSSIRAALLLSFCSWNFFHCFSYKFLNIYLTNPNSRTYTFYVKIVKDFTNCRT